MERTIKTVGQCAVDTRRVGSGPRRVELVDSWKMGRGQWKVGSGQ